MADSTLGCAQNDDGSLRNASDIVWYNDVDDSAPLASSAAATPLAPLAVLLLLLLKLLGYANLSPPFLPHVPSFRARFRSRQG